MIIRNPWNRLPHPLHRLGRWPWERILRTVAQLLAGVAALIALTIVYGDRSADKVTIHRLEAQVDQLTSNVDVLQHQVDTNKNTTDCRSRLALDVTLKSATHQQAIGHLVVVLSAADRNEVIQAITGLGDANTALTEAIRARQTYEQDPTGPCPIQPEELLP